MLTTEQLAAALGVSARQVQRLRGELPDMHKDRGTTARVYDRSKEVRRRSI